MKKVAVLVIASILALTASFVVASEVVASEGAAIETLKGEYLWNRQDSPGPIKAVFVATGEKEWNVSFYFNFRDEDHIYSGTATGSLSEGELRGEVLSDGERKQPFVFEGTFENGVFNGTHRTEGEDGEETGTISLMR